MSFSKNTWVIHVFALLHAVVSLSCGLIGIADDLLLTLLTMMLVVIICLRLRLSIIFMAVAVVFVNIVGFFLGMGLAALFKLLPVASLAVHPVATFLCTEIIGWGTESIGTRYLKHHPAAETPDSKSLRWLLVAFVAILLLRLFLMYLNPSKRPEHTFFIEIILDYIFSSIAIVWVAEYAVRSREEAEKATTEANLAHFRYLKFKQQVNPHFLFNSLNILDCMIKEQSTDAASEYTHKLAEVYRYMLKNEDELTVRLRDEMEFVREYTDLLKVRFQDGLKVSVSISEAALSRFVVPCGIQLLIENATKHNTIDPSCPLEIDIHTTENSIIVSNDIHPRQSSGTSTHLGLRYLKRQYKDIAGKSVSVKASDKKFTVILPLL